VRVAVRHPGRATMAVEATNSPEIVQADIHEAPSTCGPGLRRHTRMGSRG
jgi:hypothetical protein